MSDPDPAGGSGSATIATIAEEVGLSVATVSKALNGRKDVRPETRARVMAAIAKVRR